MADNPIYDNSIRHYLNFVNPNYGRIEIAEPEKFDAFSFDTEQGEGRFGRDKSIGAKEIDLVFCKGFRGIASEQRTLINGTVTDHLTHCFEEITEAMRESGSESEIYYITSRNGVDFVNGLLNIPDMKTDGYSNISCNIIQNTNKSIIERKKDIVADVFSGKDTFNNPRTPLQRQKILLHAVKETQISKWNYPQSTPKSFISNSPVFNFSNGILQAGIQDTLSYIQGQGDANEFTYIKAKFDLQNISIDFSNINLNINQGSGVTYLRMRVGIFSDINDFRQEYTVASLHGSGNFQNTATFTIPRIFQGEYLSIFFRGEGSSLYGYVYSAMDVKITVISQAFDTVTFGVPYYDFLKEGIKRISKLDLDAPEIQNGYFSNQYVFNGNLLRQRQDKPLNFVFKDEMSDLSEINADYQILDDQLQILTYPYFYTNIEIAALQMVAPEDIEITFNPRFNKVLLSYAYDNYEQNNEDENTIECFHTEAQFQFPNDKVNDSLEISIKHIRDPFLIESAKKDAISSKTALTSDDKTFLIDCIPIESGSRVIRTAVFTMRVENGILQILSDGFSWLLLGFVNGDHIFITGDYNPGEYAVLQHGQSVLELVPVGDDPNYSGTQVITINYPLTDVSIQSRRNEGFNSVSGLTDLNDAANLKYTIKRNLSQEGWSIYLATICKDRPEGIIMNTKFVNNGDLTTQFQGGSILKEKADILVSGLPEKILSKNIVKTQVLMGFEQAVQLVKNIAYVKGFVRFYDANNRILRAHPQSFKMTWATGIAEITAEIRNESDYINIQSVSEGFVTILEVGYNDQINTSLEWFKIFNGYVQLLDNQTRPLINPTNFKRIKINGVLYTDEILFSQALFDL